MGIINTLKSNKIKKELSLIGYNENQINKILTNEIDDITLIYFTEKLLNDNEINDCVEFLSYNDLPLRQYMNHFPFEKRMIIINIVNKLKGEDLKINSFRLFRLIYDIACDYDPKVLQHILDNLFLKEINYEFLNDLNNSYRNGENLYEKFSISISDKIK